MKRLSDEEIFERMAKHNYRLLKIERTANTCAVHIEDKEGYRYSPLIDNVYNHKNRYFVHPSNTYSLYNIGRWLSLNKPQMKLKDGQTYENQLYQKLKFSCSDCRNDFYMTFNNMKKLNYGCPSCSEKSLGENKIYNFLIRQGVEFEQQKSYDDCRDIKKLRFDFYIPSKNLLIEYNGIQHCEQVYFSSDRKRSYNKLSSIKRRDDIKLKFCKKHKIKLLVISYKDFDSIEDILGEKLNVR